MIIPADFVKETRPNKVYKLKKTLYELKQSLRVCFDRFTMVMINLKFKQTQVDHILFIKHSETRGIIAFLIYIDDIIIDEMMRKKKLMLKWYLTREFKIKD